MRANWVFLPPVLRPVALAFSCGVVALVIWDRVATPPEVAPLHPSALAKVTSAEEATASSASSDAPEAMTEQERSARNERLFEHLEREKKRLGIVKVLSKDENVAAARGGAELGGNRLSVPAEPPALGESLTPTLIEAPPRLPGAMRGKKPLPAGLVLRDAAALAGAWSGAGLAGEPPSVDFTTRMALLLSLPGEIVAVETGPESIQVRYRFSLDAAPHARLTTAPVSPLPVLFLSQP